MKRAGDLCIEQDLEFERRSWRVQKIGRGLLLLFVLAALAGLFGSGPMERATVVDASGQLQVEYPRFARRLSEWQIVLEVGPKLARSGQIEVWLDRSVTERFKSNGVLPEPSEMAIQGDRVVARFRWEDGARPSRLVWLVQPREAGRGTTRLGIVGGPEVAMEYFIYP